MSEGDGMVTDVDRERAADLAGWPARNWTELRDAIATALAEEREKARAPFLALIPKLQEEGRDSGEDPYRAGLDVAAEWIRRAAEEG